ncbi:hypothetical protein [Candidatus Nitronereus thalassa]|uniref:Uncharacterized protein n=1 Tax=Candidatus Nitronereus thalassa TaxID=3020898 RepID=A0ABU3K8S8_9BACT|nr:hypothetical protein [Candidatus Nitronereus thalassa]MDT7042786.1 hypothetical protein [Candidatus Nitronereus thalassa]
MPFSGQLQHLMMPLHRDFVAAASHAALSRVPEAPLDGAATPQKYCANPHRAF